MRTLLIGTSRSCLALEEGNDSSFKTGEEERICGSSNVRSSGCGGIKHHRFQWRCIAKVADMI